MNTLSLPSARALLISFFSTLALLSVPLLAMQFTSELNWTVGDFIIAGSLLFIAQVAFHMLNHPAREFSFKLASGLAVFTLFFIIWVNIAVGIVGSEDTSQNLVYYLIILMYVVYLALNKRNPQSLELAFFGLAGAMLILGLFFSALTLINETGYPILSLLGFHLLCSALFFVSSRLFKKSRSVTQD